jgi:hypothetical protein
MASLLRSEARNPKFVLRQVQGLALSPPKGQNNVQEKEKVKSKKVKPKVKSKN